MDSKVLADAVNNYLDEDGAGKRRVLACVVMPDYSGLLTNEIKRAELISGYKILRNKPRRMMDCIVPKEYLSEKEYQLQMRNIEFKVDKELAKPQLASQSAFLVLDSLRSVLKLNSRFKY